ncbi:MAG: hypothetical protein H6Q72_1141 [Firmicutes bacterium]|nr:hypothetical protein [Bacillota bacterium]
MSDNKYKTPKWDTPEMNEWEDEFEEDKVDERVTTVGCRPSWSPCRPTHPIGCQPSWPPCFPRQCYPRHCYPRQCFPQHCYPRQCNPRLCYPRMCMPVKHRPCNPL